METVRLHNGVETPSAKAASPARYWTEARAFSSHIIDTVSFLLLKSASNLNGNLNCSKELEHYAS